MNIKNMLLKALPSGRFYHVPTATELKQRERTIVNSIVKRNAEGNVFLSMPRFTTLKDKNKILRKLNFD